MSQANPYDAPRSDLWPPGKERPLHVQFGDEPIATFQLVHDDAWFKQTMARRPANLPGVKQNNGQWLVLLCVVWAVVASFSAMIEPTRVFGYGMLVSLGFGVVGTYIAVRLHNANVRDAYRASPRYNKPGVIHLYRLGLVGITEFSTSVKRWPLVAQVIRHPDGFVLVSEMEYHFLPLASLTVGTLDTVETVLKQSVADYMIAGAKK
jgi:hypothetical protein